ncbi:MAG: hypothetical protein KatS3mg114_1432 [Planctomycetaceae bacterium]|nr:MAG: hypothetical protein KatS3mg114_1432 [Planctomycetaceae bacterium]
MNYSDKQRIPSDHPPRLADQTSLWLMIAGWLLICGTPTSWAVELVYKFRPQQQLHYVMKNTNRSEMKIPQQPEPLSSTMQQTMHYKQIVDEVRSDGSARLRQIITRITTQIKPLQPGIPAAHYDSAQPPAVDDPNPVAQALAKNLQPLIEAEFKVVMTPRGEIQELELPEVLSKPNSPLQALGGGDPINSFKEMIAQGAIVFPDKTLQLGDSWETEATAKLPFAKLITQRKLTYQGLNPMQLEQFKLDIKISSEPMENAGIGFKVTDSQGEGMILFDRQQGALKRSQMKQTMDALITVGDQTIEQRVITEVQLEQVPASENQASP